MSIQSKLNLKSAIVLTIIGMVYQFFEFIVGLFVPGGFGAVPIPGFFSLPVDILIEMVYTILFLRLYQTYFKDAYGILPRIARLCIPVFAAMAVVKILAFLVNPPLFMFPASGFLLKIYRFFSFHLSHWMLFIRALFLFLFFHFLRKRNSTLYVSGPGRPLFYALVGASNYLAVQFAYLVFYVGVLVTPTPISGNDSRAFLLVIGFAFLIQVLVCFIFFLKRLHDEQ